MQSRVALWQSVSSSLSWNLPSGDPHARMEYVDDSHAMRNGKDIEIQDEGEAPCRSVRIFVGFKAFL